MKSVSTLLTLFLVLQLQAQKENIFLNRDFWKAKPSVSDIQQKIKEGHDPTEKNAFAFDGTAYGIISDAPLESITYMLSLEGNPVTKLTHGGLTYLLWASYKGNKALIKHLLDLGSDPQFSNSRGTNMLLMAAIGGVTEPTVYDLILQQGISLDYKNEIGANAMLVRVGALYHDIGKMNRPTFFTENQITNVNPHDDLPPKESAKIIIDHVIEGIAIAKKNNLPDRVIDFLRTHHGTSTVYYFFKKQQELDPEADAANFRYPGPIPFSKETAILMMADAVEAASKSLKSPTYPMLDEFVEKIVAGQMRANQFLNANITFKEIELVKKVLKQKLTNIYHLRVEYPE